MTAQNSLSTPQYGSGNGKIFIRNVTILDCAVLHPQLGPRGQSWYVDIIWEGKTDSNGIVFDFSLAKKAAKDTIDRCFDHRLIVPDTCVVRGKNDRVLLRSNCSLPNKARGEGVFALNTYTESLAIIPENALTEIFSSGETSLFAQILEKEIKENSPSNINQVQVKLREHPESKAAHYFSYTHSLKYHFGNCQRFHGHSNTIEVFTDSKPDLAAAQVLALALNGRYLVPECYIKDGLPEKYCEEITSQWPDLADRKELTFIRYEGSQGKVALALPTLAVLKMESESTIENIAKFAHLHARLNQNQTVVAYEGLAKGSVYP